MEENTQVTEEKEIERNGNDSSKKCKACVLLLIALVLLIGVFLVAFDFERNDDGDYVASISQTNGAVLGIDWEWLQRIKDKYSSVEKPRLVPQTNGVELGISFPPINTELKRKISEAVLNDLNVKKIRFGADWSWLENKQGVYTWEALGERFDFANEAGFSIMLTVRSNGPAWACNPSYTSGKGCVPKDFDEFEAFIRDLFGYLKEYDNREGLPVFAIQFGNEWEGPAFYPSLGLEGGMNFVRQSNIVYGISKSTFPNIPFVLGGFTRGHVRDRAFCEGYINDRDGVNRESFCSTNEGLHAYVLETQKINYVVENAQYDAVDQHLYFAPVEEWPIYVKVLRENILPPNKKDVPLVVSEFGGPHVSELGGISETEDPGFEKYHAQELKKYIETVASLDVLFALYYTLIEDPSAFPSGRYSGLLSAERAQEAVELYTSKAGQISKDNLGKVLNYVKKPGYDVFKSFSEKYNN